MPRRRRSRSGMLSKSVREYLIGFLWLGVGLGVIAFIAGMSAVLPSSTITIGSGQNAIQIQTSLFYNIIGFSVGVLFMINAVRKILRINL